MAVRVLIKYLLWKKKYLNSDSQQLYQYQHNKQTPATSTRELKQTTKYDVGNLSHGFGKAQQLIIGSPTATCISANDNKHCSELLTYKNWNIVRKSMTFRTQGNTTIQMQYLYLPCVMKHHLNADELNT